jgi:hypothetical protein
VNSVARHGDEIDNRGEGARPLARMSAMICFKLDAVLGEGSYGIVLAALGYASRRAAAAISTAHMEALLERREGQWR